MACEAGKYQNDTGKTDCTGRCESGKYQRESGKTECTNCHPGYYAIRPSLTRCSECAAGKCYQCRRLDRSDVCTL